MGNVPKKQRESVDKIVRREAPGYVISKPTASDARQQAAPDAVVPPLGAMQQKKQAPGADASQTAKVSRKRDTEVRILTPKGGRTDANARAIGSKAVIVSKSQKKIISRQG